MSDNNKEDLSLRDKIAISVMPALIQRFSEIYKDDDEYGFSPVDLESAAILAYKIADEMRKVRLQSFT